MDRGQQTHSSNLLAPPERQQHTEDRGDVMRLLVLTRFQTLAEPRQAAVLPPAAIPRLIPTKRLRCCCCFRLMAFLSAFASFSAAADCCFVEDTAVIVGRTAVIARIGAKARQGEEAAVATALQDYLGYDLQVRLLLGLKGEGARVSNHPQGGLTQGRVGQQQWRQRCRIIWGMSYK